MRFIHHKDNDGIVVGLNMQEVKISTDETVTQSDVKLLLGRNKEVVGINGCSRYGSTTLMGNSTLYSFELAVK